MPIDGRHRSHAYKAGSQYGAPTKLTNRKPGTNTTANAASVRDVGAAVPHHHGTRSGAGLITRRVPEARRKHNGLLLSPAASSGVSEERRLSNKKSPMSPMKAAKAAKSSVTAKDGRSNVSLRATL